MGSYPPTKTAAEALDSCSIFLIKRSHGIQVNQDEFRHHQKYVEGVTTNGLLGGLYAKIYVINLKVWDLEDKLTAAINSGKPKKIARASIALRKASCKRIKIKNKMLDEECTML